MEVSAWGHLEAFTPLFLKQELGIPDPDIARWTGLLAAASLVVAAPTAPFWGVLADRYNRKLFILRALLLAAVGYAIAALCTDIWQLLGVRFLFGLTFAGNAIIVGMIALLAPERRLGVAIGLIQMVMPLGRSLGPLLGGWLIAQFGLRGMFAADALLTFSAFLLLLFLLKEPPRRRDASQSVMGRLGTVLGLVWQVRPIRLLFILNFAGAFVNSIINPFVPVLIGQVYQGPDLVLVIGLTLAGYGGVAAIAAPVAGRLGDRLGADRILVFSMAGLALKAFGLMVATTPLQIAIVLLLGAAPFGAHNTSVYSLLARVTPRQHMAGVMGLTPLARNSAMLLAPLSGAAVAGLGLWAVFGVAAVAATVAVGVSLLLLRAVAVAESVEAGRST